MNSTGTAHVMGAALFVVRHGAVAQTSKRSTENRDVAGSVPVGTTTRM